MTNPSLIGRTLSHFHIDKELGRGGMAVVYRAHQTNLNRLVALKVLPPEMTYDTSYIARFQQEARAAAGLEHTHIVPIYEIGEAEGFYFIAMKYIEGTTLKSVIDQEAPMPVARVLELLEPVGQALDYAHRHGVVHRDIKPSNVMLTSDAWVYLTDFGLARGNNEGQPGLTQAGTIMGTPEYMSPEQAQGLTVGPPSDLYSLAIMAYEMLSKGTPFEGANAQSILFARVMHAPKPPSALNQAISPAVEDVLMRALARQPEARFPTAQAFFKALRDASAYRPLRPGDQIPPHNTAGQATIVAGPTPASMSPAYGPPAPGYVQRPPSYPPQPQQPASYPPPQAASYPPQPQQPPSYPPTQAASYPPQVASYPPTAAIAPGRGKRRTGLMLGLVALLAVLAVGAYFIFAGGGDVGEQLTAGAQAFERPGGLADAATAYAAAAKAKPDSVEAQEWLAMTQFMRNQLEPAKQAAQAAINLAPNKARPHAWLSLILDEDFQYTEALAQAEEAVRQESGAPEGYVARAIVRADTAMLYTDEGLLQQALDDSEQAINLSQSSDKLTQALAYYSKGYVLWQTYQLRSTLGGDLQVNLIQDGIDQFNRALGLQNQLPMIHTGLGYFFAEQGYQSAARNQDDSDEKYAKAEDSFRQAIQLDDTYAPAWAGEGWMFVYKSEYDHALESFNAALDRDAELPTGLAGRGLANWWLGLNNLDADQAKEYYTAAAKDYAAALEQAPQYLSVYSDLGYVYLYSLNDPANAEDTFRRGLEQNPQYAQAAVGLGDTLQYQGYFNEAIEAYDQAIGIDNSIGAAYVGKGQSLLKLGETDAALEQFDLGLGYNASLTDAYLGKAEALQSQGRSADARGVLSDGLEIVRPEDKQRLQAALDNL